MRHHHVPAFALLFLAAACGGGEAASKDGPWQADAHTQAAIARMDAVIAATPLAADSTDAAAFHQLGTALQTEIGKLTSGCTMTGADHDRLHVWLGEFLPQVETLREAEGIAALRGAHQAVVAALARFHVLFPLPKPK